MRELACPLDEKVACYGGLIERRQLTSMPSFAQRPYTLMGRSLSVGCGAFGTNLSGGSQRGLREFAAAANIGIQRAKGLEKVPVPVVLATRDLLYVVPIRRESVIE